MKVKVFYFKTNKEFIHENVSEVETKSHDSCVIINFEDGGFKLIDLNESKVMVKILP